MKLGIKNKNVLVVGGSKNIGEAIVKDFALEGSNVIILARDKNKLKNLFNFIGGKKEGHSFYDIDLTKKKSVNSVLDKVLKKYKNIDIIIHNIGGSLGSEDSLKNLNDVIKVWKLNVGIAIEINNRLIPHMIKNESGKIVHVSSITSINGDTENGSIHYAASKAYLNSYVKSIGRLYAKNNIVITAVLPGAVLSEGKYWSRVKEKNPELLKNFLNNHQAIGRLGQPNEISSFIVFLASNKSSFACGSIIPVDGGWT